MAQAAGSPGGFSCRLLGRWGGRGPHLGMFWWRGVQVSCSRMGTRQGSSAAQWEGWEGTSPFVVPDPAVARAGHLNFNEKYIASGWSGDQDYFHPTTYLFSFSPCFLSWLQSKAFCHPSDGLNFALCLATHLAEGAHRRSPPSSLKPGYLYLLLG